MQVFLLLLRLLPLLLPLSADQDQDAEVILSSSACSATCGLGLKSQTLCLMKYGETEETEDTEDTSQVTSKCRNHTVPCRGPWSCGIRTTTVTSGHRVEIDCLGEVMKAMGKFSWRVSWRRARGLITSDNSLFTRWKSAQVDRVILDPVREEDAGTYRCDVQDSKFQQVKRVYFGIRVLPAQLLDLRSGGSEEQFALCPAEDDVHSHSA